MSKDINALIAAFVDKSIELGDLEPVDKIYTRNRLLDLLHLKNFEKVDERLDSLSRLDVLDELLDYAVKAGVIEDLTAERDILEAKIMDLVTPLPSQINQTFWEKHEKDPQSATDYFFEQSRQNNYIKTREIANNIFFTADSPYGEIELTINLSKPEKDPQEIAKQAEQSEDINYPVNALSIDNEGYAGHINHAARTNHRVIRMDLAGDRWGFQYSPYAYYNEHSIFLAVENRPMSVNVQTVRNLLEILTILPHYFVGSNAGLPIVGGSILSHDHYQGGRYHFPIEKAEYTYEFRFSDIKDVQAGIIHWPMSVIRLRSTNKDSLTTAADRIFSEWSSYSDENAGIFAETNGEMHNAITPIARRREDLFELDLVLRNNRTSDEFPDGIFHPHPDVQHIKKENIGLIEVMGLAILPPRLKSALQEVQKFLLDEPADVPEIHLKWAKSLKKGQSDLSVDEAKTIVEEAVGDVFVRVLEDAGVFKTDEKGQEAFKRFISHLESE